MKPAQIIKAHSEELKLEIAGAVNRFTEKTGAVVRSITVNFVDLSRMGMEKKRVIGTVEVQYDI